jgi:hypothetical protein
LFTSERKCPLFKGEFRGLLWVCDKTHVPQ